MKMTRFLIYGNIKGAKAPFIDIDCFASPYIG